MPLDPHAKRLLDMVAAGKTDISRLSPEAMRQAIDKLAQLLDVKNVSIGAIENRQIPGPVCGLPVRIYTPVVETSGRLPALIYFHGGTGVFCSIETHDGLCRMLANGSGCRVFSVGYRLAPEHKFPAAIEDSYAAAEWILAHNEELEIDPKRTAVGGDSAGATLATAVCQLAKQAGGPEFALQVLICPVTDLLRDSASRRSFSEGYFFDMATLDWALQHYLTADADRSDSRLSPLRAVDLRALPAAHIHTAEFDPFRDDGKAYADALEGAGVPVIYTCHEGLIHHFYCMSGAIPRGRVVVKGIGNSVKAALV
ncbi:MAG TPA: alpha/beta hydrolase [Xanthobacteraceae bacterium]|nr:alpha/beta hydrolase [Xanthobacteraceae bacterium]